MAGRTKLEAGSKTAHRELKNIKKCLDCKQHKNDNIEGGHLI